MLGGYSDAVGRVTYPVSELLLGNGNDTLLLVERVPELGDNEEVLTLDEAVLDGTGDTLTSLLLVAVVWEGQISVMNLDFARLLSCAVLCGSKEDLSLPQAPSKRRYPVLMAL